MSARKKSISINLLIKDVQEKTFSAQLISWSFTYGRYIIIITQIIVLSVFFARFKLDRDHTDLKESVAQRKAIVESVSDFESEVRRIQRKISHIGRITTNQDFILKILRFFQNNTPTNTVFKNLSISEKSIKLSATADNLHSFSSFISELQKNNSFSEVILEDITRLADGKVEFSITANLGLDKLGK